MIPTTMHEEVQAYYGQHLSASDDLKTDATCCTTSAPPRYVAEVMPLIADEVVERFYGCGSPIPPALEGATVLDLGCGTGRDVYVLSKLVGKTGRVIGVDMTQSQLDLAKKYQDEQRERFGYEKSNVEFRLGYIEDLAACGIEDESIDLVVSNCVVNLSPFKDLVLSEVYRVLKPGGELYFSDVYSDRRMSDELRHDPVLVGECLGGALYEKDFRELMAQVGWPTFVHTVVDDMHVGALDLQTKLGFMSFTSCTVRAIKTDGLEEGEEDYGQVATYLGGMPEMPRYFDYSADIRFKKDKPVAVSGNTARMLAASRYGKYFHITEAGPHRGAFNALRAQQALEVHEGKCKIDCAFLEDAYERMDYKSFEDRVGQPTLLRTHEQQQTMQVNITYKCNLACKHCYLECGPDNTECMSRETMEAILAAFTAGNFAVMDITGGSPELHPDFEWFLRASAKIAKEVIVRSNLTLLEIPRYEHLMDVFAETGAHVVASLPFYLPDMADNQRGKGVFERVCRVAKKLNERGYGKGEGLVLDLVFNVAGPFLPPPQYMIEEAYRVKLEQEQGIRFDNLLAFNNYAIGRFAEDLLDSGMFDRYLALLADNFNAMAITRMMCLDQVNVDYDGRLYDCEVNHVLGLTLQHDGRDATIFDMVNGQLPSRCVRTHPICYSCAAGFGSSCGGALV